MTSGGVISRLAQRTNGIDLAAAIDLNLSLRNSGVCGFAVRTDAPGPPRLAMTSWNGLQHLDDARELWTYY
jgi:hypothetical protein